MQVIVTESGWHHLKSKILGFRQTKRGVRIVVMAGRLLSQRVAPPRGRISIRFIIQILLIFGNIETKIDLSL